MKKCPKCGSGAIDFIRDRSGMWHVVCFRCGFMHIACLSIRQAEEVWNDIHREEEK